MRLRRALPFAFAIAAVIAAFVAHLPSPVHAASEDRTATLFRPQNSPPIPTTTLHVYSRETVVDVTVTDSKGNPVHGLTQSDFTIEEDGKPQPVRSFAEFDSAATSATPMAPKLPLNTYTNLQTGTGPLYVLLFDDINGGDGPLVRSAAASFIKNLPPGARVALLSIGGRLTVLQGPTTDQALLLKMLNNHGMGFGLPPMDRCLRQVLQNWQTIVQFEQVGNYLSGIDGRKNLIWINPGVPSLIFPPTPHVPGDDNDLLCQDFSREMRKVYDLLEDAQVTVYPLDSSGVKRLGRGQLAMEAVAEATGGVAYYERNDLETLMAKVLTDGSSYYTLSYVPPSIEYDGKYHAIGIKVDRPGVHLLYRKGYSAEDPSLVLHPPEALLGIVTRDSTRPTDPFAAVMAPSAPPATQILFDVHIEPSTLPPNPPAAILGTLDPKLKDKPLVRYSFQYAIPASQIAFTIGSDGVHHGSLDLDIAAYGGDGNLLTSISQTVKMPLSDARFNDFIKGPFAIVQQIDLPTGALFLRIGIHDPASNKIGALEVPIAVPKNPQSAAAQPGPSAPTAPK